jgi:PKD repeat protein
MPAGTNGLPNPAARATFAAGAANPVDLEVGPGGDLFYVDFDGGTIRRITYTDPSGNQPPNAVIVATPTSGSAPLAVSLSGTTSSDPDPGTTLTYAWDTDNDGAFDDGTGSTANRTFTSAGVYTVRLKVNDGDGAFDVDTETILVDAHAPTAVIDTPGAGTTWRVGDVISFSGHATDQEQGTLPASALDWSLVMHHCPSNCHTHVIQTFDNMASGSFTTPDHEYPSHLELKLTATDATGLTHTVSRILNPQTVNLTFQTNPTGLQLLVGASQFTAPSTRTVIVGSTNTVSAPSPQTVGATTHTFISWSDGGAQTHNIVAPAAPTTYTATYTGGEPTPITLNPTDDARVAEQSPSSNKGSDPALRVRQQSGASHRSYLKFVVSGLTGAPASVKLRLFVTDNSSNGGTLYDVADSWTEDTITWNNAPALGGSPVGVMGSVALGTWAEVDLTSYVTGNGTYSIGISSTSTNAAIYSSTEGANPPQLVISMSGSSGPIAPIDDARTVEASPTANKGSDTFLRVREQAGADHRSYLKFVVSGLSGAPSQVKLRLWVTDAGPQGGTAYDVSDAWSESTITWNNQPVIGGSALASFGNVVAGTWAEIDLTAYVTGNGTYSIGIVTTSTNAAIYSSAEGTNPPQLVVTP